MAENERVFGRLVRSGRLRKRWAAAVDDPDPAGALEQLREVLAETADHPDSAADLWTDLQGSMLDDRLRPLLTGDDFDRLEAVGVRVGAAACWPLVAARAARGEAGEARALMVRLCAAEPVPPPDGTGLITGLLDVDFGSGTIAVREAGDAARALVGVVPDLDRTLGLHALLVDADPAAAVGHLRAPRDETAFTALLAAHLRLGEHAQVASLVGEEGRPESRAIGELAELSRTLGWLDDPEGTGPAPADTSRLVHFTVSAHAGEWLDYAIGRMYLLEGASRKAADILAPLAEAFPQRHDWGYHAAWALLLCDDADGVARCFEQAPGWAVGCLLQDADPAREASEVSPPAAYSGLATARTAMAQGERPSAEAQSWQSTGGPLGDHLEALRTVLGLRVARRNQWALKQAMELPLFRRLPAPERLRWSGLAALQNEPERGRALLTEAAEAHGYGRAALALAAYEAQEGRFEVALELLEGPARPTGPKPDLLCAWLRAHTDPDEAAGDLDRLADREVPHARYALGHVRLRQASLRHADGDVQEAAALATRAAKAFDQALAGAPRLTPRDARALARAAELFANGKVPDDDPAKLRRGVPDQPWATWVLGLAELTADRPVADLDPDLCGRLAALLREADPTPPPPALTALAGGVLSACLRSDDNARTASLAGLLSGLADEYDHPELQRLHGIARAAALRHGVPGPAAPDDLPLALAAARRELIAGDRDAALQLLRSAPANGESEQNIRDLLTAAIGAEPGGPAVPDGLPAPLAAALCTAQAAGLAESEPDRCRTLLLRAITVHEIGGLVDLRRALPALCAVPGRGGGARPRELAAILRRLAEDDGFTPLTLARSATAVGDHETADRAWREAMRAGASEEDREEYGRYLCHRATAARRRNEPLEAARLLRKAAGIMDGQEPEQFLPDQDEVAAVREAYRDRLRRLNETRRQILTAEWTRALQRYTQAAAIGRLPQALVHFDEMRSLANTGSLRGRWEN